MGKLVNKIIYKCDLQRGDFPLPCFCVEVIFHPRFVAESMLQCRASEMFVGSNPMN